MEKETGIGPRKQGPSKEKPQEHSRRKSEGTLETYSQGLEGDQIRPVPNSVQSIFRKMKELIRLSGRLEFGENSIESFKELIECGKILPEIQRIQSKREKGRDT